MFKRIQIIFSMILFSSLFGCENHRWSEIKDKAFSNQVRSDFKDRLPNLPKPNYNEALGRVPSANELELGRMLFNDPVLSRNNDISCATCHLTNHGFADGNALNVGAMGKGGPHGGNVGSTFAKGVLSTDRTIGDDSLGYYAESFMFRNSLSTVNTIYRIDKTKNVGLFWDGRFGDLGFQTLLPIHTKEELCGANPIALDSEGNNPFRKGGPIFKEPVKIYHTNSADAYTGRDTGKFNGQPVIIDHIPYKRPNNTISIPTRNECLAITLAKLNRIKWYRDKFKEVYKIDVIGDRHLSAALMSFISTHIADETPYDSWLKGEESLTRSQLIGMVSFFTPLGEEYQYKDLVIKGAGCFNCHDGGTFGGSQFHSLGIRSDYRSPLSRATVIQDSRTGFFNRPRLQRGLAPECHVSNVTVSSNGLAPDMGKANQSSDTEDCFKMRVPPLRNVIETFPYFHHGTERAKGHKFDHLEDQAIASLKNVILYHLRGPINITQKNRGNVLKPYFDDLLQLDPLIPFYRLNFWGPGMRGDMKTMSYFPVNLSEENLNGLVDFVAYGLWDKEAVVEGDLGNDLSHPEEVPSGLSPSITRDEGNQLEIAPFLNH